MAAGERDFRRLERIVDEFTRIARNELQTRWSRWKLDLTETEVHEVIGAFLARQVTLATQLARSPSTWNGHIAPVILRSMTDVHICVAWILADPRERSRRFILYGLGQMKLEVEHRKAARERASRDPHAERIIAADEDWINSQRWTFLTEVSLGTWSETSVRKMAEEADCVDFYNFAYTPFSAATHSAWHHISRYNLKTCSNELHRYHSVPIDPEIPIDSQYLYLSGKYLAKTFALFDEKIGIDPVRPSAFSFLCDAMDELGSRGSEGTERSNAGGKCAGKTGPAGASRKPRQSRGVTARKRARSRRRTHGG